MKKTDKRYYMLDLVIHGRLDLPEDRCDPVFPDAVNSFLTEISGVSLGKVKIPAEALTQQGGFVLEATGVPKSMKELGKLIGRCVVASVNTASMIEETGMTVESSAKDLVRGGYRPNVTYVGKLDEDQAKHLYDVQHGLVGVGAE